MSEAVVEVEALEVPGRVKGVSFRLGRGTTGVLSGPNGSGKSTVLDAVLGLVAFSGQVAVRASTIAIVPQRLEATHVLPLRVVDFLALTRTRWPVALGVRAVRARLERVLAQVDLLRVAEQPLAQLSGGELRRVLLADALEREPQLLLLDEPEVGLDAAGRRWLSGVLAGLPGRGVTTLLVSHDEALRRSATHTVELERADA
jgi:zinc transport system ATP-binding protein